MANCPVCFCILNDQNIFVTNCCQQQSCETCYSEWCTYSNSCFFCRYEDNSLRIVTDSHDMTSESSSDSENDNNPNFNKEFAAICFYLLIMIIFTIILFAIMFPSLYYRI